VFKNLIIYAINADMPDSAHELSEAMAPGGFVPCGKTQATSTGWVPPRGFEHGQLVENVAGAWIVKQMTEAKLLPEDVVKRRTNELADEVERDTGRKPGKRARRELADQARLELLPVAFTRRTSILAWISPADKLLVIDSASQSKADVVATGLIQAWPKLNLHLLRVARSVDSTMAAWMLNGTPLGLTIDRDAVLESASNDHAIVRYQNHALDGRDVARHLQTGKVPTKLALTHDARVSFVLVDDLRIQRVQIADAAMMERRAQDQGEDSFDADVAITTGVLSKLLYELLLNLGGQAQLPIEAATAGDAKEAAARLDNLAREGGTRFEIKDASGKTLMAGGVDTPDPLYEQACTIVRTHNKASISLVQRHLRIGYNRAARLFERMEAEGLVGAMNSDGHRAVLAADDVGVV
jgi:recombination associated protein RdgC